MRFTIRHLLWFTILVGVGCWWWMPSSDYARTTFVDAWFRPPALRLRTAEDAREITPAKDVDFDRYDAVCIPGRCQLTECITAKEFKPEVQIRAHGQAVFAISVSNSKTQFPYYVYAAQITVPKGVQVYLVSEEQFTLIDYGVAVGLLTLAVGSLFIVRKRKVVDLIWELRFQPKL